MKTTKSRTVHAVRILRMGFQSFLESSGKVLSPLWDQEKCGLLEDKHCPKEGRGRAAEGILHHPKKDGLDLGAVHRQGTKKGFLAMGEMFQPLN